MDYSGPALQICFNEKYVTEFLNVVETDAVELELKDEVSQAVHAPRERKRLRLHVRDHADAFVGAFAALKCRLHVRCGGGASARVSRTQRCCRAGLQSPGNALQPRNTGQERIV